MKLTSSLISVAVTLLTCGCANRIPPSGGPVDEIPPTLLSSIPEHEQLNYKEQTVTLTFDENVQENGLKGQLIISPSYDGDFDVKVQKTEVVVTFDEPFGDSTTYLLNFREGIADLTEKNPAVDLQIAFSTGSYLDSLFIEGDITNLLTDAREAGITIGAYPPLDSINPIEDQPLYFTKSTASGTYALQNLRSDTYKIYAFLDINNNLLFDPAEERSGFVAETIVLDTSRSDVDILVHDIDLSDLSVLTSRQNGQYYEVRSSKYITQHQLSPLDSADQSLSDSLVYMLTEKSSVIRIFNTGHIPDSLGLQVTLRDSLLNEVIDTTYVAFIESARPKDEFTFSSTAEVRVAEHRMDLKFNFNKPITQINFDSVYVVWDSLRTVTLDSSHMQTTEYDTRIQWSIILPDSIPVDPNTLLSIPRLEVDTLAFLSVEGDTANTLTKVLKFQRLRDFGIIQGEINIPYEEYLVQLLDNDNRIVRTDRNLKSYRFDYLSPGNYRIRVLVDENMDGTWFPGSLISRREPEPVIFYTGENGSQVIALRPNWELVDMDILPPQPDVDNGN